MFAVDADHRQPVFVTRDALVSGQGTWLERMAGAVDTMHVREEGISNDAHLPQLVRAVAAGCPSTLLPTPAGESAEHPQGAGALRCRFGE